MYYVTLDVYSMSLSFRFWLIQHHVRPMYLSTNAVRGSREYLFVGTYTNLSTMVRDVFLDQDLVDWFHEVE
jgi:hypothetical protein